MGDYHHNYLKKDVLLLTDVFEKFIDTCLKYYGLNPCHYFSSPGLSLDAMLKMTNIELGKISDIDKYLFIEKGLRGGISYIAKRYAKANNKYLNDYDPKKPSTFISYLDMNNLYGRALSEYLPYGGFKWIKNIDKFDIMSINDKSPIGYFLEVDLEKDFEVELEKSFGKDFFKLIMNSVYGKTMENLRKGINVRLVNNEKGFLKYTSRPTYITHKIFGKDYAAIHEIKPILILDKPTYIGFTVLDLSKWKMYDFRYNFIKKNFDAELLFTDTDSLSYEIKSKDVYEEFFKRKDLFDFSNYSKDSKFFNETNKKVIGKMKDEFGGVIIIEIVGLKSKMYSIKK